MAEGLRYGTLATGFTPRFGPPPGSRPESDLPSVDGDGSTVTRAGPAEVRGEGGVGPGDGLGFALGAVPATGVDMSLRFSFRLGFAGVAERGLDGGEAPGVDRIAAAFTARASSITAPRVLLDLAADARNDGGGVALRIRVGLPTG